MRIRQHGPAVEIWTPAKLNLFLEVTGKRSDGYHEIVTLIAAINRFDTLSLVPTDDPAIELDCRWAPGMRAATTDELPSPTENLAWRALRQLQQRSGCGRGARAALVKRIPAAAGLGGGSSDAAAALVAGNLAWKLGWPLQQLAALGAELGSDVPVFLHLAHALPPMMAVCRGRGEHVTSIRAPAGWHFVVARPASGLSTASVYRHCTPGAPPAEPDRLLAAIEKGNAVAAGKLLINRLQPAAEGLSPQIMELSRRFDSLGALGHQLSGSGTAHFGWFASARCAARAAAMLRGWGLPHAWCAQSI